jgi:hypothetical protein
MNHAVERAPTPVEAPIGTYVDEACEYAESLRFMMTATARTKHNPAKIM